MNHCTETIQDLARRLKARDSQAMTELYDLYHPMVQRIIFRVVGDQGLAEDLAQETFLRVWKGISAFDEERGSLTSWISAVARNNAVDYVRSPAARNARVAVELREADLSPMEDAWPARFEHSQVIGPAFERLTESQRLVVSLSFVEGMSHAEIARNLNRPLGTIKAWLRRALRTLAANLDFAPAHSSTGSTIC